MVRIITKTNVRHIRKREKKISFKSQYKTYQNSSKSNVFRIFIRDSALLRSKHQQKLVCILNTENNRPVSMIHS